MELTDPLCYSLYLVKMKTQNTHTHYTWLSKCGCVCCFFLLTCHRLHRKIQGKKWHWQSSNSEFEICWMCMGRLINSNYRFSSELNVCATSQSNDTILCAWCVLTVLFVQSFSRMLAHLFRTRFTVTPCVVAVYSLFPTSSPGEYRFCVWENFTCGK